MKTSQSIRQLLSDQAHGQLKPLLQKLQEVKLIEAQLKTYLSAGLAEHCEVVNYQKGRLLLAVSNNSWAARLRFQKADLLQHLRGFPIFSGLATIAYIVQPLSSAKMNKPITSRRNMGAEARQTLHAWAKSVPEGELKEKLTRMSRRLS